VSSAPPFRLPGTHFIGVLVSLLLGAGGLVVIAPDLAAAQFLNPRVFAVTHLFTLGVIVTAVFGALYQFYPMSLGAGARSVRVGVAGAWLMHAGTALVVAGFWWWQPALQAAGWWAIFLAVGCVAWNLLPHRRRMTQGRRTAAYVSLAHAMLGFAMIIAAARIGASLGWWQLDRLGAIAAHFHLAAFGFAGLTAVGVGGRMLPMFLVSGPAPERPFRIIGPVATGGLALLTPGFMIGVELLVWAGALLGVAAAALFVRTVAGFFSRRLVHRIEPAFGHVIFGFVSLVIGLGTALVQLALPGFSARGWVVYAELVLLGWLVVFITGVMYRLLPFLIWLHFYARLGSSRTAAELVNRPLAWVALGLLGSGIVVVVAGTAAGSAVLVRVGAGGFLAGSVLVAAQYPRMFASGVSGSPAEARSAH
jgi:hypothetical protein